MTFDFRIYPSTGRQTVRLFAKDITGDLVKDRQEVRVNWRAGQLVLDEPSFNGGKDIGPDPFTAVLSGLVGCTLTTLRMYINRKGWDITDVHCTPSCGISARKPCCGILSRRKVN